MSIKEILKAVLPPIITSLASGFVLQCKMKTKRSPYRRKVDTDHRKLDFVENDLWQHPNWISHVKHSLASAKTKKALTVHQKALILAFDIVHAKSEKGREITVVDFGGGVGSLFYSFKNNTVADQSHCQILVVDNAENVAVGRTEFSNQPTVDFITTELFFHPDFLSSLKKKTLIVNLSSLLHYTLDWQHVLEAILQLKPEAICITRLPVCPDATQQGYAVQDVTTSAGYCGSTKVVLFKNGDIEQLMGRKDYSKIYDETSARYNFFWDGCSMPEYKNVLSKAYLFYRS